MLEAWLASHGLTEADLTNWKVKFDNIGLAVPVFSLRGQFVFQLIRRFKGGVSYEFDPVGCRRGMVLYGLHRAVSSVTESKVIIITEGFSDTISLHKHGIQNSASVMGSAMSTVQAALASVLAPYVLYFLDGDETGENAARQVDRFTIETSFSTGFIIDGFDPSEALAARLPVQPIIDRAHSLIKDLSFIKFNAEGQIINAIER